jgi:uncharacterized protein (TIGR03790 family)
MIDIKMRIFSIGFVLFLLSTVVFILSATSWALTPEQVVVVANSKVLHSIDLAKYYMRKRMIPPNNLIEIKAPTAEHCSREDYEKFIVSPIRAFLKRNDPEGDKFRCLVTMYGIPLRVRSPQLTPDEQNKLADLRKQRDSIATQIKKAKQQQSEKELKALRQEETEIKRKIDQVGKVFQGAAVDSELALVREDNYPLEGWLPNKYFLGFRGKDIRNIPEKVLLVSRLDGSSEEIVRRIIDDSLQAEKEGLQGKAYFDARWPDPRDKEVKGSYGFYDRAIHKAAWLVEKSKRMEVVIDSQAKLFQPGECPDAALYCGWYSLAHYVDAFTWVRGAVGFHIASQECQTLKGKGSQVWCKMMLEKGVAATLGPVGEPYLQTFPVPDLFFGLLVGGQLSLAECYGLSNPFWSWKMVLIGDPLYRPFMNSRRGN